MIELDSPRQSALGEQAELGDNELVELDGTDSQCGSVFVDLAE